MPQHHYIVAGCALLAIAAYAVPVSAQNLARASVYRQPDYPLKPVRMIVPLAPGGGSDIVGRILASGLNEFWAQSVVVDNRPGAGSTVGTAIAARAAPDGYTLLVSSSSIAISPALYKKLEFDIRRDFTPVTMIASQPSILAVHSAVAAASVRDLIALAKAQPGTLAYGSAGSGSATHLGTELFKYMAGIDLIHVPYKSAGQATAALLGGEVQVLLTNMASVLPHAKTGRIKALGISSLKRSPLAPEVPTIAESGVAGFEYATWYAMLAPAGTPPAVIDDLQRAVAKVLATPLVQERFSTQGLDISAGPAAALGPYLETELRKWDKVVRAAGIKIE